MKLLFLVLLVILFVLLTPGILLTLPKKGAKLWIIALTHGVIFAIVWFFIYKALTQTNYVYIHEGNAVMNPVSPNQDKKTPDPTQPHPIK